MLDNPLNDLTQLLYPLSTSFSSFVLSLISLPARSGENPFASFSDNYVRREFPRDSQSQIDKEDAGHETIDDEDDDVSEMFDRSSFRSICLLNKPRSDLSSFPGLVPLTVSQFPRIN